MKFYKTVANTPEGPSVRWAGTQAEAVADRKAFNQSGIKRADIRTDDVEIPTDKKGLLTWLNENVW